MRNGKTLFKGMTLSDVVRMQVDIETVGLSSAREDDRILVIAVRDNRGLLETLTGVRRAGADLIITYHAKDVASWLR